MKRKEDENIQQTHQAEPCEDAQSDEHPAFGSEILITISLFDNQADDHCWHCVSGARRKRKKALRVRVMIIPTRSRVMMTGILSLESVSWEEGDSEESEIHLLPFYTTAEPSVNTKDLRSGG